MNNACVIRLQMTADLYQNSRNVLALLNEIKRELFSWPLEIREKYFLSVLYIDEKYSRFVMFKRWFYCCSIMERLGL